VAYLQREERHDSDGQAGTATEMAQPVIDKELRGATSAPPIQRSIVRFSKHRMQMAEQWLDEPIVRPAACDVLLLQQYTRVPDGALCEPFRSLVLDLSCSEEQLLQGLNRDTKYKVRRAETKDHVVCIHEPVADEALCRQFSAFHDEFAASKGVGRVSVSELLARGRAGALRISRAVYRDVTVVWHVHAATPETATLLYSASHFRNLVDNDVRAAVGRANRLLHWSDILKCKGDGLKVYDFGGWYAGTEDDALLKINQFKEGFGGTHVEQINAAMALSVRGWIYLKLRRIVPARQRKQLQIWSQKLLRR